MFSGLAHESSSSIARRSNVSAADWPVDVPKTGSRFPGVGERLGAFTGADIELVEGAITSNQWLTSFASAPDAPGENSDPALKSDVIFTLNQSESSGFLSSCSIASIATEFAVLLLGRVLCCEGRVAGAF